MGEAGKGGEGRARVGGAGASLRDVPPRMPVMCRSRPLLSPKRPGNPTRCPLTAQLGVLLESRRPPGRSPPHPLASSLQS